MISLSDLKLLASEVDNSMNFTLNHDDADHDFDSLNKYPFGPIHGNEHVREVHSAWRKVKALIRELESSKDQTYAHVAIRITEKYNISHSI